MRDHRAPGDRVQDLRHRGLHTGAFASGENDGETAAAHGVSGDEMVVLEMSLSLISKMNDAQQQKTARNGAPFQKTLQAELL
jgi:hypothetical protein